MQQRIANLHLTGKVFLAPMAGVNDIAFRIMCHKYGSALNFTEMINVNAVQRGNKATLRMANLAEDEGPISIQLFGTKIDAIKKTIKVLEEAENPQMFDFNFGCPVKKIMTQGAGCALLKRPSKVGEIVSAMRNSTDIPISAKIRLGITPKSADYLKTAKVIQDAGADLLIVHGRYQNQGYSGKAHWDKIKEIKESLDIPVVGNGDVVDERSAKAMIEETGCNFLMVGRAAMGNPFIFSRINKFLSFGEMIKQKNKPELFEEYLELAFKHSINLSQIKDQAMQFTKGLPCSARLRDMLRLERTAEGILALLKNMKNS
jgi:tRNA-dihydrouridine synthase B